MATRPWPPNNTARVAVEGLTAKGVNWANIFWISTAASGTPTPAQCSSLAQAVYGAYNTRFFSLLGKDASLERAVCNFYGAQPTQVVGDYLDTTAGGSDNDTEIDSLSAAVSWTIPATWRGGKPRSYMPALPTEAFEDSNTLADAFVTALETAAASFITDMRGLNVTPFGAMGLACISFFSGNQPRVQGVGFDITSGTVHPRIDSMRRRLGKEIT